MSERLFCIALTDEEYLSLLRLVLKYGSGTGVGTSTISTLRRKVGGAETLTWFLKDAKAGKYEKFN